MVDNERVIAFIREKGPVVPNQLANEFRQNTMIMGAVLSTLAAQKKVIISSLKMGGSPVYYLPDQKALLENFIRCLNEKDRDSVSMLKEKKVLRDGELTPLLRVSMRNIKDFAKPLEVTAGDHKEIFWKYYLVNDDEATELIGEILEPKPARPVSKPASKPSLPSEQKPERQPEEEMISEQSQEAPQERKKREKKEDFILSEKGPSINDPFHSKLSEFFAQGKISVVEARLVKRNSEMEYVLDVPSAIGTIEFFCKAKSKKTINEGDLSTAFIAGQHRKLPILFLTNGSMTKKAQDMLGKEFKGMVVKKVS